jgi:hypothetical protein
MYVFKLLYAFFYEYALHHHPIGTLSLQYPINKMIHSGFAHDVLNFGVLIGWRLIVQIHPNRAHPIICRLLR